MYENNPNNINDQNQSFYAKNAGQSGSSSYYSYANQSTSAADGQSGNQFATGYYGSANRSASGAGSQNGSAYYGFANQAPSGAGAPSGNPSSANKPHKSGTGKKVIMSICLGLLFGLFAGAGFYSVNLITKNSDIASADASVQSSQPGTSAQDKPDIFSNVPSPGNLTATSDDEKQITVLTTQEGDITSVVADVMPSMVSITEYITYQTQDIFGQSYSQDLDASGSGIIIGETDEEYIIVTNNHVIKDANSIEVSFIDDTVAKAYLKGTDASRDIGVISVLKEDLSEDTLDQIKVANLGDSENLVLGQRVIAIGNALGYGQSVTTGIVSALNREITTSNGVTNSFIQTDAAINPGNSGGALLDIEGNVIGINSNKIGETRVEGMGYAIPISSVREIIEELMGRDTLIEVDEDDMGYVGIYMQEVTPEISAYYSMPQGIYVTGLVEDGGAEKAGIKVGDILTGFDGNDITTNESLKKILKYYAVGDEVEITFMRNENGRYVEKTATVTLGKKPR